MSKYHDFPLYSSDGAQFWIDVMPGDLVHSPGTLAFKANEFHERDGHTSVATLAHGLLLVISKHDGCPGEDVTEGTVTYVCMSRHGPMVIMKRKQSAK